MVADQLYVLRLVTLAVTSLVLVSTDHVVTDNSDIQALLDSVMRDETTVAPSQRLNLPDTSATVGRIFTYPLGLNGQAVKYKIRELGKSDLPSWLTYNRQSDQLEGVARPIDVGVSNIAVIPDLATPSSVKHFFTISVVSDATLIYKNPGALNNNEMKSCRHDDPITMVTVVIDADPDSMDGAEKAKVVKNMASFLQVVQQRLSLLPLDDKPAYDSSALVAGPGDRKTQQHKGVQLMWQIGCGSVDTDSVLLLEKVELTAINGKLGGAIGYPVIGWHVTNNKPQMIMARKRRQLPVATPTYDRAPPTKVGSELDTDMARAVPDMTSSSPSGHHRGSKTAGRHAAKASDYRYASPVATPTNTPIVPTPVTPTSQSADWVRPTQIEPSQSEAWPDVPVARTDIPIQPSHTLAQATPVVATPTEALPTDRYRVVEESSKPTSTGPTTPATEVDVVPTETVNENPYVNKELKRIDVKFGEVVYYRIPQKTFLDKEDGNTRHLKLMVLYNKHTLTRMHWLQFDSTQQVLKGILLDDQNKGRQEFTYTLAAIDSGSRIAQTEFQIVVKTPSYQNKSRINHEFTMQMDADYDVFVSTSSNAVDVVENLGRVFALENPYKDIAVLRIEKGSVLFTFTLRNVVKYHPCPAQQLRDFIANMITANGTINNKLADEMHPKWQVKGVEVKPMGPCTQTDFPSRRVPDHKTPHYPPYEGVDDSTKKGSDGALITYIIPGIIIGVVFILAIIIACILHCKRRRKQMEKEKNHFSNKGIPVIFADELDEKPEPPSKPLIMPEEKPPMPPPQYLGSRDSPGTDRHRLMYTEFDRDVSPPYRPPPPFANNSYDSHQSKPRGVNSHKQPQPYVPP